MYLPDRYTFHTFSDAAANDRVAMRRAAGICWKVLEATANIMVNFPLSFLCVVDDFNGIRSPEEIRQMIDLAY
jgi:hypothetical protein